uniref:Uncharacterized protein n=1 Tax=Rhizophora mucronata TaxID=61149 RepID=A0A2P2NT57_RHIMU
MSWTARRKISTVVVTKTEKSKLAVGLAALLDLWTLDMRYLESIFRCAFSTQSNVCKRFAFLCSKCQKTS